MPEPKSRRPRTYPVELREQAVRLARETAEREGTKYGVVQRIARQLGIEPDRLGDWVRQDERGHRPVASDDQRRIAELEQENRELRRANEILKAARLSSRRSSTATSRSDPLHRQPSPPLRVEPICTVLEIAPSTYYARRGRPPSRRSLDDAALSAAIARIHAANYAVYGVRKLWHALLREGVAVGRDRVARLMRALGLAGAVRGRRARTTVAGPADGRPSDLVERSFLGALPESPLGRRHRAPRSAHEPCGDERTPPPARRSGLAKLGAARTRGCG